MEKTFNEKIIQEIERRQIKFREQMKKPRNKEDVERLEIPLAKQMKAELYQEVVSKNLEIEMGKELRKKLNPEEFDCKSKREFVKRKNKREHQENVYNLEENKRRLGKKRIELKNINKLLSKIPAAPWVNRKFGHLKYQLSRKPGAKIFLRKRMLLRPLQEKMNDWKLKISIRIKANNIFCTLGNSSSKRTLIVKSAGKYGIKISKRNLKVSFKNVLKLFLQEIKKKVKKKQIIIEVISPTHIRKQLINFIFKNLSKWKGSEKDKKEFILNIKDKKCFNGCKPKKKRRKKRKGLRIFK